MKILIDMNLSPEWVIFFKQNFIESVHWSTIGDPCATDFTILQWAKNNQYIVFTNDLDFGAILAATQMDSPSVIQIRSQDLLPQSIGAIIIKVLSQFKALLASGALLVIDDNRARIRILPIN